MLFVCFLGAGFFCLFKNYKGDTGSSFATVGDTAMMLFGMTLGEYEVFTVHLSYTSSNQSILLSQSFKDDVLLQGAVCGQAGLKKI